MEKQYKTIIDEVDDEMEKYLEAQAKWQRVASVKREMDLLKESEIDDKELEAMPAQLRAQYYEAQKAKFEKIAQRTKNRSGVAVMSVSYEDPDLEYERWIEAQAKWQRITETKAQLEASMERIEINAN